jgi:hypothetical protein
MNFMLLSLMIFLGLILTPSFASATLSYHSGDEAQPIPSPDMPRWTEQPQNQTVEYGDSFSYQVNISGSLGYWWFVSDNVHFRINAGVASDHATITNNRILNIGVYYLRITCWDVEYDRLEAEIWITVQDTIIPEVSGPENLEFMEGERNHTLTWSAHDANPYYYSITKNGAIMEEGYWVEPHHEFYYEIGFIPAGTYAYVLELWDAGENSASWSVTVHVRANESAQVTSTEDPYARTGEIERVYYVPEPEYLFIELFAIVVLSGLTGLVMISAIATKKHEFGFD